MKLSPIRHTNSVVVIFIVVTWITSWQIGAHRNPNGWSEWTEQMSCDGHRDLIVKSRRCNSRSSPNIREQLCSCKKGNATDKTETGTWSTWSAYSPCSNETGTKFRTRQCDYLNAAGQGTHCVGPSVETAVCGNSLFKSLPGKFNRLKQTFRGRKKTVSSRDECIKMCLNSKCEVFQVEYQSTSPNRFYCRISTLRATYLPVFSKRYLELDPDYNPEDEWNVYYEIYYFKMTSDFKEYQLPELFYPLDNISKNANIGKLDSNKFALNMGTSCQKFECDFAFGQSKFLTLMPSDNYRINIPEVSSIPFNPSSNFTLSLWVKKRVPQGPIAPIIEGTSKDNTIGEWLLWNYDAAFKLHPLWGRNKALTSPSFNGRVWNHVVMRVDGSIMELFVNNQWEGSVSIVGSVSSLGDYISIGRRIGRPAPWGPNNNVFDGCIGHLMLFTRSITHKEIIQFSRLTLDERF